MADFPTDYRDPLYAGLDSATESKLGLPVGMLSSVRVDGEKTNADRISSASAKTPYQITPATRSGILKQYGIDAYLSPDTASEAAGLILRDSLKRNDGDPETAVREYHGGTDPKNWGKINDAYWQRVSAGMRNTATKALSAQFGKWMADNPASPPAAAAPPGASDAMGQAFGQWLSGSDQIPGAPIPAGRAPASQIAPPQVAPGPGIIDTAVGTGEAALNAITGATGGALGMAGGTILGAGQQIAAGNFGTPQGADAIERAAASGAQAMTYAPRSQSGQDQASIVGNALQQAIPIMGALPGLAGPAGAMRAGAGAVRTGAAAVLDKAATAVPQALRDLPGKVGQMMPGAEPVPTAGTMGSAGAAGTDMAAQRTALAESMPVPIRLTKGQASRDPAQLKFEVETAKIPDAGAPLRERLVAQNDAILRNFDAWADQTGAEAPSLRATGAAVDKALVAKAARDKTEVRAKYAAANSSPEAFAAVDPMLKVAIGEGETALTSSPIDYLNAKPTGLATTALADHAKQMAVKLGIAEMQDGQLIGTPSTIKSMEAWRREISQATGYEPADIRDATILKKLIDAQTEPVAGPLYRQARDARAKYAQQYENRAVIAKLLDTKRGMADRQVALEDVFGHSILKGSLDDVRHVRRVLQTGGEDGLQAWRELQGATARHIRDKATQSVATDGTGNRVLSPAALDRVIRDLDSDGKLDFIFGKQGAQKMRDIAELAQIAKTVPPEAAVNFSNTASTLMGGVADIAGYGMTGAPVPVFTLGRMALKYVKDAKLRRRIIDALDDVQKKQAPGKNRPVPIADPGASVY